MKLNVAFRNMPGRSNCNTCSGLRFRVALSQSGIKFAAWIPVSILYKSIASRCRPVRVADGSITARYRFFFTQNASWDVFILAFVSKFVYDTGWFLSRV